jgi:hypothetical protein
MNMNWNSTLDDIDAALSALAHVGEINATIVTDEVIRVRNLSGSEMTLPERTALKVVVDLELRSRFDPASGTDAMVEWAREPGISEFEFHHRVALLKASAERMQQHADALALYASGRGA